MKPSDIRALSHDERREAIVNLKKELFNLRFQRASGQLENTSRFRAARRDVARLKTVVAEIARPAAGGARRRGAGGASRGSKAKPAATGVSSAKAPPAAAESPSVAESPAAQAER